MYIKLFKRIIDTVIALLVLIIISPIFIFLCVVLACLNKSNIFFTQYRPGKDEKYFKLIKFKTMNDKMDQNGKLLSDSERLNNFGKFLRKTSLDELPQFINIFKGNMSLIGPRPLFVEYLSLYNENQHRRHLIRPGITGWAQINGRNTISWQKKFEYDVWYVDNISFLLDFKIIFITIIRVFQGRGISQEGHATIEKFKGNE